VKRIVKHITGLVPELMRDVVGLAGVGAITYGAWLIFRPAGWIVAGVFCLVGAWLSARASGAQPGAEQS